MRSTTVTRAVSEQQVRTINLAADTVPKPNTRIDSRHPLHTKGQVIPEGAGAVNPLSS
jgi:hypothetical protein